MWIRKLIHKTKWELSLNHIYFNTKSCDSSTSLMKGKYYKCAYEFAYLACCLPLNVTGTLLCCISNHHVENCLVHSASLGFRHSKLLTLLIWFAFISACINRRASVFCPLWGEINEPHHILVFPVRCDILILIP